VYTKFQSEDLNGKTTYETWAQWVGYY